jgi:hypothetical protein
MTSGCLGASAAKAVRKACLFEMSGRANFALGVRATIASWKVFHSAMKSAGLYEAGR